ncbi:MAG: hypothetical protein S4CHLAM2_09660 [Chlamydiales bacterium]|nr:hypothetical protein [Chlamydiales bacterium]
MKILLTTLFLFPLFSSIQGNQPETRLTTEWLEATVNRPYSFGDKGDTVTFTVTPRNVRAGEALELETLMLDYLNALHLGASSSQRALYENELRKHGVTAQIQRAPRQPAQQPQTREQQRRAQREARRERIRQQRQQQRNNDPTTY